MLNPLMPTVFSDFFFSVFHISFNQIQISSHKIHSILVTFRHSLTSIRWVVFGSVLREWFHLVLKAHNRARLSNLTKYKVLSSNYGYLTLPLIWPVSLILHIIFCIYVHRNESLFNQQSQSDDKTISFSSFLTCKILFLSVLASIRMIPNFFYVSHLKEFSRTLLSFWNSFTKKKKGNKKMHKNI